MLVIVPADESVANACREKAHRGGDCLSMTENGEWKGFCLYDINSEKIVIHTLSTDEDILAEGLVRAAINVARNREIPNAICTDTQWPQMLRRLGFKDTEDGWQMDVADFFKPCCSGCSCS